MEFKDLLREIEVPRELPTRQPFRCWEGPFLPMPWSPKAGWLSLPLHFSLSLRANSVER